MADASIDSREFRNTMGLFATGVTVVTARVGQQRRGMTANSFTSVSLHPPLLLVCVDNGASMHPMLEVAESFAVNILAADQRAASDAFARHGQNEAVMNGIPFHDGPLGSPILDDVMAWVECRVEARHAGGDQHAGRGVEPPVGPFDHHPARLVGEPDRDVDRDDRVDGRPFRREAGASWAIVAAVLEAHRNPPRGAAGRRREWSKRMPAILGGRGTRRQTLGHRRMPQGEGVC